MGLFNRRCFKLSRIESVFLKNRGWDKVTSLPNVSIGDRRSRNCPTHVFFGRKNYQVLNLKSSYYGLNSQAFPSKHILCIHHYNFSWISSTWRLFRKPILVFIFLWDVWWCVFLKLNQFLLASCNFFVWICYVICQSCLWMVIICQLMGWIDQKCKVSNNNTVFPVCLPIYISLNVKFLLPYVSFGPTITSRITLITVMRRSVMWVFALQALALCETCESSMRSKASELGLSFVFSVLRKLAVDMKFFKNDIW